MKRTNDDRSVLFWITLAFVFILFLSILYEFTYLDAWRKAQFIIWTLMMQPNGKKDKSKGKFLNLLVNDN